MRTVRSLFGVSVLLVALAAGASSAPAQTNTPVTPVTPGDGTQPGLRAGGVVTSVAPQGRVDVNQGTGGNAVPPGAGAGVGAGDASAADDEDNTVAGWLMGLAAVGVVAAVAALVVNRARAGRGPDAVMTPRR